MPFLHLRRNKGSKPDIRGLYPLTLTLYDKKKKTVIESVPCNSGQPYDRQVFELASSSQPGSCHPIPEGQYEVSGPFWAGVADTYTTIFSNALGPVVCDINPVLPTKTARGEFRIHLDANYSYSPGTAGCIGIVNLQDLKKVIRWVKKYPFMKLYVNYGFGTIPDLGIKEK